MSGLRSANGPRNVRQPQTLASYAARIEVALETASKCGDCAEAYGYLAQSMQQIAKELKASAPAEPSAALEPPVGSVWTSRKGRTIRVIEIADSTTRLGVADVQTGEHAYILRALFDGMERVS